jgi:LPS sulfotransferase NodH
LTKIAPPPDWTVPRKVCLIAAIPRCGSNLLCSAMYRTGALGCPDEYFNEIITKSMHPGAEPSIANQLRFAIEDGAGANGVVSIKLLPYQFRALLETIDLGEWFGRAYWIWLRREDILAQAISSEIATQTNAWTSHDTPLREAVYSEAAVARRIGNIVYDEAEWSHYFRSNRIAPLELWYRVVARSPERSARKIARFLDEPLPPRLAMRRNERAERAQQPGAAPRFPDFKVQRNHANADWARRFRASAA